MTASPRSIDAGFTLIEALVVLTIAAAAIALVPATVKLSQRALQVAATLEQMASDHHGLSVVTDRLAAARPTFQTDEKGISALAFDGRSDRVRFVTQFSEGPAGGGLYLADLGLDAPAKALTLTVSPYPLSTNSRSSASRTMIMPASALALRYFGVDRETGDRRWQPSWMGSDRLPEMVELTIAKDDGPTATTTVIAPRLGSR